MMKYKVYKGNVLEVLGYFSDKEFQKVAWFENDQGLSYSFSENVSDLYDDFDLEKALYDSGIIVFSPAADQALRELNDLVESIGYDRDERELIDSPEMQTVREKAAQALALVKASDGSESTVEIVE